ncbi:unnamed protein product [Ectocarpus sp. 6 AP-2014]
MNLVEMAFATVLGWLCRNLGHFCDQTTRKTPRIGGTLVDTAIIASRDLTGPRNNRDGDTSSKNLSSASVRTRAVSSWSHRVILLVTIAAINLGLAEGILVDLPSGLTWHNLPRPVQCVAVILVMTAIFKVNRLFDKIEKTVYARLASAVRILVPQEREEASNPAAAPVASLDSTHASAMPPAANPGPPTPASDGPAVPATDPADMEAAAPAAATASAQPEPPRRVGRGRTFLGALCLGSLRALSLGSRIASNVAGAASSINEAASRLCEALSDVAVVLGGMVAA